MKSIQIKRELKKKKKILSLLQQISALDETIIEYSTKSKDPLFKKIEISLKKALSCETKLRNDIIKMSGLSGRKFRVMLNHLIDKIQNPKYLEIGSWLGSTACSACFNNKLKITCIDDWSQNFNKNLIPKNEFKKNIKKVITDDIQLNLIQQNFREINFSSIGRFNIYLYDAGHTYNDHFDAIDVVLPALTKKFILIVDDWNWKQVRQATNDAIKKNSLKIISQISIRTTRDDSSALITSENSDWHQGCSFIILKK